MAPISLAPGSICFDYTHTHTQTHTPVRGTCASRWYSMELSKTNLPMHSHGYNVPKNSMCYCLFSTLYALRFAILKQSPCVHFWNVTCRLLNWAKKALDSIYANHIKRERWIWKVNRGIWEDFREIKLSYVVEVWGGGETECRKIKLTRIRIQRRGKH